MTSRPYSSPRSWATTRSPTTPSSQVWTNPPTAWMQNSADEQHDQPVEPGRIAAGDHLLVIPAITSGKARPASEPISSPTRATENGTSCGRR